MSTLKQGKKFLELVEDLSDDQLQRLYSSGLLTDVIKCQNPELVDRKEFQRVLTVAIPKPKPILDLMGTVMVPMRAEKFIARDNFIVDTSKKAKVKISYLGDNFKENFLTKIEESVGKTELRYHKLRKSSVDGPILAELGGKNKAETMLAEMFGLMEMQPNGEKGALFTNGYANIFYIRDAAGVLWAVYCDWHVDGWRLDADSVESPIEWGASLQVFSRNSSEN